MKSDSLNILILDDDEGDRRQVRRALKQSGLQCECTETANVQQALEACETCAFDCAVVDYRIPGQDGLFGISVLNARLPYMAIVMSTGQGDETIAAEAMKRGASDYIPKSLITPDSILRSVTNAIEKATLRRQVERQREELKNFARVLAHDLKAPIQSVRGFARAIEENLSRGNLKKTGEYCLLVARGVERMGALIDALHGYLTAENPVAFEDLDMGQVTRDTLANLEHIIRERGARVTFGELPAVSGHGPLLTQLLQNLIANGIKYCKSAAPCVHVAATQRNGATPRDGAAPRNVDGWLFTVQDNGIGIPEKDSLEVFEPFKRLHGIGEYEGTGLGLATCKKIVERHKGRIWCESKGGHGTTFFFTLPPAQGAALPKSTVESASGAS